MPYTKSAYAPETPLPGFPLTIAPHPVASPIHVTTLMRVFHRACEEGNMPLANDTFITLRAAINEYALHHFEAVSAHMSAVTLALTDAPASMLTPNSPDDRNSDSDGEEG